MTIDRIFIAAMLAAGVAAGAILVAVPASADFAVKPYFWIIVAVAAFDLTLYLRGHGAPGTMLSMEARLLGFVIGIVLMVAIPRLLGAPMYFF